MKIINNIGASSEFKEDGVIYEFPYPPINPTDVPEELAKKLIATGQYKEFEIIKKPLQKTIKKSKKGVDDNAL